MAFYCWYFLIFVFVIFNHMHQNSNPKYVTVYCCTLYTCACVHIYMHMHTWFFIYIFLGLLIDNLLSSFCILCPFVPFGIVRFRVMFILWTPELFIYNYFDIKNRLFNDYCCIKCKTLLQTLAASSIIIYYRNKRI